MRNIKCIIFIFFPLFVFGQTFVQTLSLEDYDVDFVQHSLAEVQPGQYVVAGTVTPALVSGNSDVLIISVDNQGNILWKQIIDYGQDEFVGSIIVDNNMDIVFTGYTGVNGGTSPNKELILVKLDTGGTLINDVVIQDGQLGYSLYGMDVEQMSYMGECGLEYGYVVVGTGAQAATSNANKFGFVLGIDDSLSEIFWGNIYQSSGVTNEYDSFNSILKVNHPWGGEVHLLIGSGKADNLSNWNQMVTLDLVNSSGASLWSQPVGFRFDVSYDSIGVMALYKESSNSFFVLFHGGENQPFVVEVDAYSGNILQSFPIHYIYWPDFTYIITGMEWKDSNQTEIVLAGYQARPDDSTPEGVAVFMEVNVSDTSTSPLDIKLIKYHFGFDSNEYLNNTTFDFISQPLNIYNPLGSSASNHVNQHYYKPKGLIKESVGSSFVFSSPQQFRTSGRFGLNLYKTNIDGELEGDCFDLFPGETYIGGVTEYSNFNKFPYHFEVVSSESEIHSIEDIYNELDCSSISSKSYLENVQPMGDNISLYPNPTTGIIHLSSELKLENIKVYNMAGQNIDVPYSNEYVDLSGFSSGLYWVKVEPADGVVRTFKIIKK